jgi:hypothetical protein
MTTTGSLLSFGPIGPIALHLIVIPFLTDLLPKTVGTQDTIIQVVLSARGAVMRDKTGLTRYHKNLAQIRHDPNLRHNRYRRTTAEGQAADQANFSRRNERSVIEKAPAVSMAGASRLFGNHCR